MGKDDRIIEGGRLLKRDIHAQRIAQTRDEQLNLLWLRQCSVTAGENDEALGKIIHATRAAQHGELVDRAVGEWLPESCIH
jgi:hypothetical protein